MDLQAAVIKAVDDCIRDGILAEFLTAHRAEVVAMSIFEYDQEKHIRQEKEESWEDGYADGRKEGNQMYLEVFALPFYVSDVITFHTKEAMVALEIPDTFFCGG